MTGGSSEVSTGHLGLISGEPGHYVWTCPQAWPEWEGTPGWRVRDGAGRWLRWLGLGLGLSMLVLGDGDAVCMGAVVWVGVCPWLLLCEDDGDVCVLAAPEMRSEVTGDSMVQCSG